MSIVDYLDWLNTLAAMPGTAFMQHQEFSALRRVEVTGMRESPWSEQAMPLLCALA
jgi:hypothetical protein